MQAAASSSNSVRGLLQRRRVREALAAATELARSQPEVAEHWHLLSLSCQQAGRVESAIRASEKALALEPSNGEFSLQYGMALALSGRSRRAGAQARSLVPAAEGNAVLQSRLGTLFSLCGDHAGAYRSFHEAVCLEPARADHSFNRAVAARALGKLDEAESACNDAIALGIRDQRVYYVRSDLRRQTPAQNHLQELEQQLARNDLNPMDVVYLRYALGKEQDDLGHWEAAFRSYREAAGAYRGLMRYDPAPDYAALDALMVHHNRTALAAIPAGDASRRPIFVVGLPRSGTTLVERIVQGHACVEAVGESQTMAREIGARAHEMMRGEASDRAELVRCSLAIDPGALADAYWSEVGPEDPGHRPLDKMPINYLYCGLISRAFPAAKIIAIRRAPLDSCFSAWKAFLTGPYGFTYDLDELGDYYLRFDRLLRHWSRELPAQLYHEVHYESLVTNTEPTVQRLMDFLNLPYEPALLDFHRSASASATASAAQVRQPIYTDSVGRARHFEPWLASLRQRLLEGGVSDLYDATASSVGPDP